MGDNPGSAKPLQGVKVWVADRQNIAHLDRKLRTWTAALPRLGAQLVPDAASAGITHVVVGAPAAPAQLPPAIQRRVRRGAIHLVQATWVEACLAAQQRADEAAHRAASATGTPGAQEPPGATGRTPASESSGDSAVPRKRPRRERSRSPTPARLPHAGQPAADASGAGAAAPAPRPPARPLPALPEQAAGLPAVRVADPAAVLQLGDLRDLLAHLLAGGPPPGWAQVQAGEAVSKVVVLMLSGLSRRLLDDKRALLPNLTQLAGPPVVVKARHPTNHPIQSIRTLFSVPVAKKRKAGGSDAPEDMADAAVAPRTAAESEPPFPPEFYALTHDQMRAAGYPLPPCDEAGAEVLPPGWVTTAATGPEEGGAPKPALVACDCEMVITTMGFEMARASVVGAEGQVLMDEFCIPDNPIVNHNTRYSGIDASTLADVTQRVPDIQRKLLDLVGPDTLLVGHTLQNDLEVLRVVHRHNLDTALMYLHPLWPPSSNSLKSLTSRFLKRRIQDGAHDSVDDALATLQLAQLKLARGPPWGIFGSDARNLVDVLEAAGRRCMLVDRRDVLSMLAPRPEVAREVRDDSGARAAAVAEVAGGAADLVWVRLAELSEFYEQRAWTKLQGAKAGGSGSDALTAGGGLAQEEGVDDILARLDAHVRAVHEALPRGALLLVCTGQGDTAECRRMQEQRGGSSGSGGAGSWRFSDSAYQSAASKALRGLAFITVKT